MRTCEVDTVVSYFGVILKALIFRSLKNHTPRKQNVKQETYPRLNMMESLKTAGMKCDTVRVNVLTPSPERALPNKPDVTVISDDSGTKHRFVLGRISRTV